MWVVLASVFISIFISVLTPLRWAIFSSRARRFSSFSCSRARCRCSFSSSRALCRFSFSCSRSRRLASRSSWILRFFSSRASILRSSCSVSKSCSSLGTSWQSPLTRRSKTPSKGFPSVGGSSRLSHTTPPFMACTAAAISRTIRFTPGILSVVPTTMSPSGRECRSDSESSPMDSASGLNSL